MAKVSQVWLRSIAGLLVATLAVSGCSDDPQREVLRQARDDGKPLVVCTIGMISDAAQAIGGDSIHVYPMMGPGTDPHSYQATTSDMRALGRADLILCNGLHLEAKLGEILKKREGQTVVVPVGECIPEERLRTPPGFGGLHDPHVWFDLSLWRYAVEGVASGLAEILPKEQEQVSRRRDAYLAELDSLDQYVRQEVARIPADQRVLVTAHDAFGYFGLAYGFEVVGLQGVSTSAEAGIADVRSLADLIVERRIPAVFIESSVPVQQIEAVQAAVLDRGWQLSIGGELFSDAMGDGGTPEGTYFGMVRHNVDTIVAALTPD